MRLKSDSFVVESNVYFPTDYNLLWNSARKCLDVVSKFLKKYKGIEGWRKFGNWRREIKGLMRELGKASASGGQKKQENVVAVAERYLVKARMLLQKLTEEVPKVVIPKLGRRNKTEEGEEHSSSFKKLKNKHSAIESNINELEHRGLDRCPDRGYPHFKKHIGLGVSAYNLKKIGRQIPKLERAAFEAATRQVRKAA